MPSFEFRGRTRTGQVQTGTLLADTRDAAIAELRKRQITLETALARSSLPDELQEIIARGPAALNPNVGQSPAAAPGRS